MEKNNLNLEKNIELLKINQESYKNHFDWVVKIFIIYFAIVGTLFGFITKSSNNNLITTLYIIIILASIIFIYASILIKIWVKKFRNGITEIMKDLEYNIDYLFYPAQKASALIIIVCTIILLTAVILLGLHLFG